MLRRQRGNSWGVVNGQSIAKNIYCIGVLACGRGKGDVQFLRRGRLYHREDHAQFRGRLGQLLGYYQPVNWIARIDQDCNFRGGRNHFPQYFYSFAGESGYVGRKTRYVAARTRQALDEAETHGKGGTHDYNRNAGSCRFQGYGCLCVGGDEHIGAESYQLGGESWQAILGGGITILDNQVSSINPAMVSQPVKPQFLNGRLHHIHGEKANPTTCPLRPRAPWRNEQHRSGRNELPPPHCITSSSRTNSEAAHMSGSASVCLPLCEPRAKRHSQATFRC